MTPLESQPWSRRERQIMDVLYAAGEATSAEVLERLADPPSYSAVRALLRVLEEKGHVRHVSDGKRYLWVPTVPAQRARSTALRSLLSTFFEGSAEKAVAALIDLSRDELSDEELSRLAALIDDAKKEGR